MRRTFAARASNGVVVTLLSPSPAASRHMKHRLQQWTRTSGAAATTADATTREEDDELDQTILSNIQSPLWKLGLRDIQGVDSVVWQPNSSSNPNEAKTVLQWISLANTKEDEPVGSAARDMQIFAIQQVQSSTDDLVQGARHRLAQKLQETQNSASSSPLDTLRRLGSLVTGRVHVHDLLPPYKSMLPWIDIVERPDSSNDTTVAPPQEGQLKEIVLPADAEDDHTVFNLLANHSPRLHRPVTGVYQIPKTGLCLRPLPSAMQDRSLSPPTLIFHCENLGSKEDDKTNMEETQSFKIGYSGHAGKGQLLLRETGVSPSVWNLDIRLCSAIQPSSMFAEAQESLLASSLSELQSTHVMTHQKESNVDDDPKLNKMDCWVEFRANMSHPRGFLPRSSSRRPNTAKAPDLPYE